MYIKLQMTSPACISNKPSHAVINAPGAEIHALRFTWCVNGVAKDLDKRWPHWNFSGGGDFVPILGQKLDLFRSFWETAAGFE